MLKYVKDFSHCVNANNKRALKVGSIGNLTLEEFEIACAYFEGKCAYSGEPIDSDKKMSIEHIIPIISGGHSMAFNCIPAIGKYNSMKSAYHLLDWWRNFNLTDNTTLYTPYRLTKLLNYMVKSLECIGSDNKKEYILKPDEVDMFLEEHKENLECGTKTNGEVKSYSKINQIEFLKSIDMMAIEDNYELYSGLQGLKLNPAIFFEEAIHVLAKDIPEEILEILKNRINDIPNIYIDGKKVFKKEMKSGDIEIRKRVLKWAEDNKIENEFGIIGYMDFEVLKKHDNIEEFLNARRKIILDTIGANEIDFNNIVNKIPNVLTNFSFEKRVDDIEEHFKITRHKSKMKSSEMYRYLINKPDLILSGESMEILLEYTKKLRIDKRLLKKNIPIATIVDNVETCIDALKNADLDIDEQTENRILDKFINNSNGNLIRDAYKNLRDKVKSDNPKLNRIEVGRDAARWLICISEKYNSSEIFKERRINKTKPLYKKISFDEEGYMKGVNRNAYIVPKIIRIANLNISRETEANIINDVFYIKRVKAGERVDKIYDYLVERVKLSNRDCDEEHIFQDAARWFVFLAENPQLSLNVMFENNREKYADITENYYKSMRFDENGDIINQHISELDAGKKERSIGEEYINMINSFFNSKGNYYLIGGNKVQKEEVQEIIYREVSKCKNKRAVKNVCIRLRKELSKRGEKNELSR